MHAHALKSSHQTSDEQPVVIQKGLSGFATAPWDSNAI